MITASEVTCAVVQRKRRPLAGYMSIVQTEVHPGMRSILVDWLVEVSLVSLIRHPLLIKFTCITEGLTMTCLRGYPCCIDHYQRHAVCPVRSSLFIPPPDSSGLCLGALAATLPHQRAALWHSTAGWLQL